MDEIILIKRTRLSAQGKGFRGESMAAHLRLFLFSTREAWIFFGDKERISVNKPAYICSIKT